MIMYRLITEIINVEIVKIRLNLLFKKTSIIPPLNSQINKLLELLIELQMKK